MILIPKIASDHFVYFFQLTCHFLLQRSVVAFDTFGWNNWKVQVKVIETKSKTKSFSKMETFSLHFKWLSTAPKIIPKHGSIRQWTYLLRPIICRNERIASASRERESEITQKRIHSFMTKLFCSWCCHLRSRFPSWKVK